MAHNDDQASMDALIAGLAGGENLRIKSATDAGSEPAGSFQILDVDDSKWYTVYFNAGVFTRAATGESE